MSSWLDFIANQVNTVLLNKMSSAVFLIYTGLVFIQFFVNKYLKIKQSLNQTLLNYFSQIILTTIFFKLYKKIDFPNLNFNFLKINFFSGNTILVTIASVFVAMLLLDLAVYIGHRITHSHSFLWAFHEAHHSSTELNLSTASRTPWLMLLIYKVTYWPMAIVLFSFGISEAAFLLASKINELYGVFNHCGYPLKNKYISKILITPHDHSLHHRSENKKQNSNYAGVFSIYDHIFKTYSGEPSTSEYGCNANYTKNNILMLHALPFINFWRALKQKKNIAAKLKFVVLGKA